jgi:hypothetical protein
MAQSYTEQLQVYFDCCIATTPNGRSISSFTFLPGVTPGVSRSTMKPLNALDAGHLGSGFVRAKTKYLQHNHNLLSYNNKKN